MNAKTPRWSCRIVRAWVAIAGDGQPNRGAAGHHVAHCLECHRFFAVAGNLDEALQRSAPAQRRVPAAGMDQRILRAVRESARQQAAHPPRSRRLVPILVGAAAAMAVTFAILQIRYFPTAVQPGKQSVTTGQTPTALIADGQMNIADSIRAVTQPVSSALQRDPLKTEVDNVYADARSAVRFLALNFLPADAAAQNGDNGSRLNGGQPAGG